MKQHQNNRRQRSRGNGRRYPNQKGGSFESNGPEVKVRGTAQQVLEKYQALARDAYSSGDRILAEGYLQHAEHYYRILNADSDGQSRDNNRGRQFRGNRDEEYDGESAESESENSDAERDDQGGRPSRRQRAEKHAENRDTKGDDDSGSGNASEPEDGKKAAGNDDASAVTDEAAPKAPARKPRARRPRQADVAVADAVDQPNAGD